MHTLLTQNRCLVRIQSFREAVLQLKYNRDVSDICVRPVQVYHQPTEHTTLQESKRALHALRYILRDRQVCIPCKEGLQL